MSDDRLFERNARAWLELGPAAAPGRVVEAALLQIESTSQKRGLRIPWRFPIMNRSLGVAGAAVVAVIAIGVAIAVVRPSGNFGGQPTRSPTPTPTAVAGPPIADGTYTADIPVAGILAALDADTTLTPTEKTAVIDDILGIRGATMLNMELTVGRGTFMFGQAVDGGAIGPSIDKPWLLTSIDDKTIGLQDGGGPVGRWEVVRATDGPGFTLIRLTPAPSAVEAFVSRTLFASVPYRPKG